MGSQTGDFTGGKRPRVLYTLKLTCPACNKSTLSLTEYAYEVAHFKEISIVVAKCDACGYTYRTTYMLETGKPKKIRVRVDSQEKLNYLVFKSPQSAIYIPGKGLEELPGPLGQAYITTIEGVLNRFLEASKVACGEDSDECKRVISWLERASSGLESFDFIICDADGGSKVIGEDVKIEEFDEECAKRFTH